MKTSLWSRIHRLCLCHHLHHLHRQRHRHFHTLSPIQHAMSEQFRVISFGVNKVKLIIWFLLCIISWIYIYSPPPPRSFVCIFPCSSSYFMIFIYLFFLLKINIFIIYLFAASFGTSTGLCCGGRQSELRDRGFPSSTSRGRYSTISRMTHYI